MRLTLQESVDDEDEVLVAIADELGNFTEFVGGPQYAHVILNPLATLAAVEETSVRDKVRFGILTAQAVESAAKVVVRLSQHQIEEFYIPIIKRLAATEWFTSRASASGLFAPAYPLCSPIVQEELRKCAFSRRFSF